jgi:carbamoylphosphate synthase small subunit
MYVMRRKAKIPFLGYLIRHSPQKGFKTRRKVKGAIRIIRQYRYDDIHLNVDTRKIIRSLREKGFCDQEGASAKPNFQYLQDPQSFTGLAHLFTPIWP